MQTDGIEVASVGNTVVLHESCLIEAFNLKSAIQYNLKNCRFKGLELVRLFCLFRFNAK